MCGSGLYLSTVACLPVTHRERRQGCVAAVYISPLLPASPSPAMVGACGLTGEVDQKLMHAY